MTSRKRKITAIVDRHIEALAWELHDNGIDVVAVTGGILLVADSDDSAARGSPCHTFSMLSAAAETVVASDRTPITLDSAATEIAEGILKAYGPKPSKGAKATKH
jgi:hypothetical protein